MAKGKRNGVNKGRGRRRSKAENMTEASENEVQVRKVKAADQEQMDLPKPNDFHFHMKAIKGALDRLATATSLVRNARKAAKQVHKGLPELIKEMIALERGDVTEFKKRLEMLGFGLKELGSSIQLTIHDTLLGDVKEQAFKRGAADSANNKMSSNPYPVGSDLAAAYDEGFRKDQERILGLGHNSGKSEPFAEDEGDDGAAAGEDDEPEIPASLDRREPATAH